jgi:hypothetical protein
MTLYNPMENTPVFANSAGGITPMAWLGPINLAVTVMGLSPVGSGYVMVMFPPGPGRNPAFYGHGWVSPAQLSLRPV